MSTTYDLLIVTDATASMGSYLDALRTSIPEILALAQLSGAFSRLGVMAYKDYSDQEIITWSGWNPPDLANFVRRLQPTGGGDMPEAAKTALIRALQEVNKESRTLILWYADAPPHHLSIQSYNNDVLEVKAFPKDATDWVKLCYSARNSNCTVFSFTPNSMSFQYSCFYVLLSQLTAGICINTNTHFNSGTLISRLTLDIILQWMGQNSEMKSILQESAASYSQYETSPLETNPAPSDEADGSQGYLPPTFRGHSTGKPLVRMLKTPLEASHIPLGSLASQPFNVAKRFADPSETSYRESVYTSLAAIIDSNVFSLTYNPVFGQLWRAVCKDQSSEKIGLLNAFSRRVSEIDNPEQKAGLQAWLEESFNAVEEIEKIVAGAEHGGPMVYLDLDADIKLTRIELLEVSRSCYSGVLKKLVTIFTHLKLVENDVQLAPTQRSIPLSLPPRDFFRILPHLVVPGTLYPSRAASLTAILSLVTAVPFLRKSATELLASVKGTWLNLDIPENISYDCARFLLSAPEELVLTTTEKRVYESMRRYNLIELNFESIIKVQVPWTPEKTRGVGDRKIQCKSCSIQRSVTMMSHEKHNICGLCISAGISAGEEKNRKKPEDFVSGSELQSCWVECSTKTCRAQYVIEDVSGLKIRPRCYYCRNGIDCPWVECIRCTNRVIIPVPYRSSESIQAYLCPACNTKESQITTIISQATTVKALVDENGAAWLGFPHNDGLFQGKTAFKLMQAYEAEIFGGTPNPNELFTLTFDSKKVHDPAQALLQVEQKVGRGEIELECCTLCFEEQMRNKLVAACGRSGCRQRVDEKCLREWYGHNKPGKLLNLMQFTCPFCRRKPTVKTLTRYNPRAATLGDLQLAMNDRNFFYAWCLDCGFAKQAQERVCCQGDQVAPVNNFRCADCTRLADEPDMLINSNGGGQLTRVTGCPQCGVMVEKIYGCNHIECQCGQHFCHACGKGCSAEDIYTHMALEHGGAYDDDEGYSDDEEYDE